MYRIFPGVRVSVYGCQTANCILTVQFVFCHVCLLFSYWAKLTGGVRTKSCTWHRTNDRGYSLILTVYSKEISFGEKDGSSSCTGNISGLNLKTKQCITRQEAVISLAYRFSWILTGQLERFTAIFKRENKMWLGVYAFYLYDTLHNVGNSYSGHYWQISAGASGQNTLLNPWTAAAEHWWMESCDISFDIGNVVVC